MADRYDTTGNPEDEYYPDTSVLINLEEIRDPEELLERETELQIAAYEEMFGSFDETLTPDLPFFYYLHHMMFSSLYAWAGLLRCHEKDEKCSPVAYAALQEGVSESANVEVNASIYSPKASWALVSGVSFLACVVAVIVAGMIFYNLLRDFKPRTRWLLFLLVFFVSVDISLLISLNVSADKWSPAQTLIGATVAQALPAVSRYNRLFDSMSLTATLCLAFAACATLWQRDVNDEPKTEDVARRVSMLRYVLYVGAALLALGVLRLSAMLSWGQSFLAPGTATGKSVSTLVAGITTSLGVYFTLLMLGMYLPAALLLRERARRVAEGDDLEAKEDWLKKHGLAISVTDYIPRVFALLGPLLAGPIGELLKNAFTSTP